MKELCAKNAEGNQVDDQTQNINKLEMQAQLLQGELNEKDRKLKDMSNKLAEMARRF
jgi:predicted RNase H-like nuclease (RuvC/YqgF family)